MEVGKQREQDVPFSCDIDRTKMDKKSAGQWHTKSSGFGKHAYHAS